MTSMKSTVRSSTEDPSVAGPDKGDSGRQTSVKKTQRLDCRESADPRGSLRSQLFLLFPEEFPGDKEIRKLLEHMEEQDFKPMGAVKTHCDALADHLFSKPRSGKH